MLAIHSLNVADFEHFVGNNFIIKFYKISARFFFHYFRIFSTFSAAWQICKNVRIKGEQGRKYLLGISAAVRLQILIHSSTVIILFLRQETDYSGCGGTTRSSRLASTSFPCSSSSSCYSCCLFLRDMQQSSKRKKKPKTCFTGECTMCRSAPNKGSPCGSTGPISQSLYLYILFVSILLKT
jgi:hypothetical protein